MSIRYILVKPGFRDKVDLRNYKAGIEKAVYEVCGDRITVSVEEHSYVLSEYPGQTEVRVLGRKIVQYCPELQEYRKVYLSEGCYNGVSHQIFKAEG